MFCLFRLIYSLFPLILSIFIFSIIGFIFNTIFLIVIKKYDFSFAYIIIQIGFIISIILSSILLTNILKKKNNCIKNLTCISIILAIFFSIDTLISFSFIITIFGEENDIYYIQIKNISLFVINLSFVLYY